MSTIKLYSTNCPKCKVLETKLKKKNIEFELKNKTEDLESLIKEGYKTAPVLEVDGEKYLFAEAVNYINNYKE